MRIAVLALQGAFIEHEQMLSRLGVSSMEIRKKEDLEQSFDGLIIPGGESTVQGKLMYELGLSEPLKKRITEGFPVFGTCAGHRENPYDLYPCAIYRKSFRGGTGFSHRGRSYCGSSPEQPACDGVPSGIK